MDSSQNAYNEDTSALVARLDELERALFQAGQKGLNNFQCWEMGQASQITVSSLVQNYKKRKFNDLDNWEHKGYTRTFLGQFGEFSVEGRNQQGTDAHVMN